MMPARPISTFATEGWHRPSSAHSAHYFRPSDVTRDPLQSLCDHWTSSEDIRPLLTTGVTGRACLTCRQIVVDMLLAPQTEPWFPEPAPIGPHERPYRNSLGDRLRAFEDLLTLPGGTIDDLNRRDARRIIAEARQALAEASTR
jgi:hypothetical protein